MTMNEMKCKINGPQNSSQFYLDLTANIATMGNNSFLLAEYYPRNSHENKGPIFCQNDLLMVIQKYFSFHSDLTFNVAAKKNLCV